jgi:motility quorum-sensing regulator / GCU-specific mRNA interferase toxin
MEKSKQTYLLADIKAAFADKAKLNRTYSSKEGAHDLAMTDDDVVAIIQALELPDFDKSMTSYGDHTIWQDVYKPTRNGRELYVKFTRDAKGQLLLISFKEAEA